MSYHLIIEDRRAYLYARVTGERTPANAMRFLEEAYAACVKGGHSALLLEMALSGPSLPVANVYDVISRRAPEGLRLRMIAYVQTSIDDREMPQFAENVARNRGVNVRLFPDVAAAERWLSGGD